MNILAHLAVGCLEGHVVAQQGTQPQARLGGEIGLSGECRGVANLSQRVKEAARLGFTKAVIPQRNYEREQIKCDIEVIPVKSIYDILKVIKSQPGANKPF